jgi:hypothetical protein
MEKREGAAGFDDGGLPNKGGAGVDGLEVDEVLSRLKNDFGASAVAGIAEALFGVSDGLSKP